MGLKRSRSASLPSPDLPATPSSRAHSVEVKLVHLDLDAASAVSDHPAVMKCSLPPHGPLAFASFEAYDVHYQQTHMNRCSDCQRNFPDAQFLGLHIAENHDPISAARRDRGEKTFACLVPSCDRLCSTPHKRRLHCIDKHQFPRDYDFFVVNDGIDRRSSMLRPPHRRRSSTLNSTTSTTSRRCISEANGEAMEVVKDGEGGDGEAEAEDETEAKGSPRAPVKLRGRGGFTHPRGSRGSNRGRGYGAGDHSTTQRSTQTAPTGADPMDSLASGMSALQFVPHSLYSRGRGRGRGG
ncbi:hypothetical protein P171DRAFT_437587 [Karstenula rhodostoma CBS 690.94]|uniref:C2H2-type domain-containing protein n=1 Tax=Karstenula rhodostoma CBS 690.94 TaxID=1392251 RepID=A0A9P4P6Y7_9PLEO|nr:hypothetical protein P171DRAFT_437587 [Karstenula rhodostoma CBS 690.94]